MKRNPKRIWRSVISVVLVFTLVLGMAASAFAASTTPEYVDRDEMTQKVEELYGMVEDYCATDAEAQKVLDKVITAVNSEEFAEAVAEMEAFLAEEGKTIDSVIDEIVVELNDLNAYLYELKIQIDNDPEAQAKVAEIEGQIKDLEALLNKAYDQKDALIDAAEKAQAAIDKMVEIAVTDSDEDMAPSIAQLKEAIQDVATALEEVQVIADNLCNAIDEAVAETTAIIEEIDVLNAEIKANIEELEADVKAEIEAIIADIEAAITEVESTVAEAITAVETAIDEAKAIAAEIAAAVEAAIDEAIAYVEARIEAATTCDYEVNKDSYLVALGDSTAYGKDSYVAKLAAKLEIDFDNLSEEGMTADALYDVIEDEAAKIAEADLITVGFGNAEIMAFAYDNMLFDEADIEWAKYVGKENVVYVEDALAEVEDYLVENVGDAEVAAMLLDGIEAYAYGYTALACSYPKVINEIKEVNADAQIIIVGMYNPLSGVAVDVEGTEVAIGDYIDYVIAASNAHYFGYSLITGNAIYVDAPKVETGVTAGTIAIGDLLEMLEDFAGFAPTENGHIYISEQILDAMNVTKAEEAGLLGDADDNGEVDVDDAQLIMEWYAGLVDDADIALDVCNVDGSGEVDVDDAQTIMEYYAGLIDEFPAAK